MEHIVLTHVEALGCRSWGSRANGGGGKATVAIGRLAGVAELQTVSQESVYSVVGRGPISSLPLPQHPRCCPRPTWCNSLLASRETP